MHENTPPIMVMTAYEQQWNALGVCGGVYCSAGARASVSRDSSLKLRGWLRLLLRSGTRTCGGLVLRMCVRASSVAGRVCVCLTAVSVSSFMARARPAGRVRGAKASPYMVRAPVAAGRTYVAGFQIPWVLALAGRLLLQRPVGGSVARAPCVLS